MFLGKSFKNTSSREWWGQLIIPTEGSTVDSRSIWNLIKSLQIIFVKKPIQIIIFENKKKLYRK